MQNIQTIEMDTTIIEKEIELTITDTDNEALVREKEDGLQHTDMTELLFTIIRAIIMGFSIIMDTTSKMSFTDMTDTIPIKTE